MHCEAMEVYDLEITPRLMPGIQIGDSWLSIDIELPKTHWKLWLDAPEKRFANGTSESVRIVDIAVNWDWNPIVGLQACVARLSAAVEGVDTGFDVEVVDWAIEHAEEIERAEIELGL